MKASRTPLAASAPPGRPAELSSPVLACVDVRVRAFTAEAVNTMGPVLAELGFTGPEILRSPRPYPVNVTLRYRRETTVVETTLALGYGGQEHVYTTVAPATGAARGTEVGRGTAHTGPRIRRALDHQSRVTRAFLMARR
ncbi:hypothetical protein EES43_00700 [Streptomyces sp. ADI96-02]|uniref:hypothetical protein n=1 Tax=unclassified Streptomyces TaxID=2593676 RepID=UPI000F551F4F|nr:hypothetical protein [Streptomyces sp. ADI96-02]RPK69081.1 hypothetical protein EES43_00700 [Streptomyces sp. ADI96-02]